MLTPAFTFRMAFAKIKMKFSHMFHATSQHIYYTHHCNTRIDNEVLMNQWGYITQTGKIYVAKKE